MFGIPGTPSIGQLSVAGLEPNVRNNDQEQMTALQKLYAAAHAQNHTPQGRIDRGFNQFGPQPSGSVEPMLPTPPTPPWVNMGAPPSSGAVAPALAAAMTQAQAAPAAPQGPTSVGGAPLSGTADQWNTVGGLGPQQAPSGPDVIRKLMSYFGNKDNPSSS